MQMHTRTRFNPAALPRLCTGQAAHKQIAHLVYLDGVVPRDGQSDLDVLGQELAAEFEAWAASHGDGWCLPPAPGASAKLTAHPLKPLKQPLSVKNPAAARIPRTFIYCTESELDSIARVAARVWTEGWQYYELPTGHMAMVTMPKELVKILLGLAGAPR